jgi:hypothetical protein
MTKISVSPTWKKLLDGGMVATDANGEAQLKATGCTAIYVYQKSTLFSSGNLTVSSCNKANQGSTDCSTSSTYSFDDCKLTVETASASVNWDTTWLSVTYDERFRLTLVTVHEGEVRLQPTLEDGAPAGEPVFIPSGQFAFTVPDEFIPDVEARIGLPVRAPLPLSELVPLIEVLGLQERFQRMNERLVEVDLEPALPVGSEPRVRAGGGPLEEEPVQRALLTGVDWNAIANLVAPNSDQAIIFETSMFMENARAVEFNPDMARAILEEMGYANELQLTLLVPQDSPNMGTFAEVLIGELENIGVFAEFVQIPPGESFPTFEKMISAGEPTMLLSLE